MQNLESISVDGNWRSILIDKTHYPLIFLGNSDGRDIAFIRNQIDGVIIVTPAALAHSVAGRSMDINAGPAAARSIFFAINLSG